MDIVITGVSINNFNLLPTVILSLWWFIPLGILLIITTTVVAAINDKRSADETLLVARIFADEAAVVPKQSADKDRWMLIMNLIGLILTAIGIIVTIFK
jgi:hypothetical protein